MNALFSLLAPAVINGVVSEMKVNNTRLQNFFGGGSGGRNIKRVSGRQFAWDVFDHTRTVATARLPGTPPARVSEKPIAIVQGRFPRVHEAIPLLYEQVHNQRRIGGVPSDLDLLGKDYISEQELRLKQKVTNHREFQFAAMLRGAYQYSQVGDDLLPAFNAGTGIATINYQVPQGNLGTLDATGDGAIIGTNYWGAAGTPTIAAPIITQLYSIDTAMQKLTGLRFSNAMCTAQTWGYIQANTSVIASSGTANKVFERLEQADGTTEDFTAVLTGVPWVKWHVISEYLYLPTSALADSDRDNPGSYGAPSAGTQSMISPLQCIFLPTVSSDWVQYWEGSEVVVEWIGREPHEEFGEYYYATPTANPAGYELISLLNGIPALKNPKAFFNGSIATS